MARICIVDDDFDYCEELECALAREGHDVITAATGIEAIERGSLFRPDVLITDWMLKGHIHGLNVSDVLSVVYSPMRTILMTGFASHDLQTDARSSGVIEFVEKPFHLGHIRRAVSNALSLPEPRDESQAIGVFEVDERNRLVYASCVARKLLQISKDEQHPELIPLRIERSLLQAALTGWSEFELEEPLAIIGREFLDVDSRLYIVVSTRHSAVQQDERIQLLLGSRTPPRFSEPLDGHVLVVDNHSEVRRVSARVFRVCSCFCHTAENHDEAIRLLERDPKIRYLILDYDMPGADVASFIARVSETCPAVKIIGTSAVDVTEKFAPLGVKNFLPKPWKVEDLLDSCKLAS